MQTHGGDFLHSRHSTTISESGKLRLKRRSTASLRLRAVSLAVKPPTNRAVMPAPRRPTSGFVYHQTPFGLKHIHTRVLSASSAHSRSARLCVATLIAQSDAASARERISLHKTVDLLKAPNAQRQICNPNQKLSRFVDKTLENWYNFIV